MFESCNRKTRKASHKLFERRIDRAKSCIPFLSKQIRFPKVVWQWSDGITRTYNSYTHTYIYIYIGSGKRAYSALPPFYSPYTASIGDYQRSINRVATFPTFLARYSTVLTTVELEQARFPRSVYLRQTDLGKSWPRIKLIGIRRSLFNVIGEEGKRKKKGLKRNDLAMEKDGHAT